MTGVILRSMKTAISVPDELFAAADALARRLGVSRSRLYADAVARYVDQHRDDATTAALDAVYERQRAAVDPVLAQLQRLSIADDEW